jgi:hypothetical protein
LTNGIPLDPVDLQCWADEDGTACLQIDKPALKIKLEIWCDDKEALYRALGRYWGSHEDSDQEPPS